MPGDPPQTAIAPHSETTRYVKPDERVVLAKQILELFGSGPFQDSMSLYAATESVVITAVALLDSFLRDEPADPELLIQARRRRDLLRAIRNQQTEKRGEEGEI